MRCRATILGLVLVAAVVQTTAQCCAAPLQITDLESLVEILDGSIYTSSAVISPNGTRVAYVTITAGHKRLWIADFENGTAVPIGPSQFENWAPVWSPDGKKLAFYSGNTQKAHVSLWDSAKGEVRRTGVPVAAYAFDSQWTPDSVRILVPREITGTSGTVMEEPSVTPVPAVTVFTSTANANGMVQGNRIRRSPFESHDTVDLVFIDALTEMVTTVAPRIKPAWYRLSPDGSKILYTVDTGSVNSDVNNRILFDVKIINVHDRSTTTVARDILTGFSSDTVTWSHNGSMIAFIGGTLKNDIAIPMGSYGDAFPGNCYIIDVHHPGKLRRIGGQSFQRTQGPLLWSNDDSVLYAAQWNLAGIIQISLKTGMSQPSILLPKSVFWNRPQLLSNAGGHIYAKASTDEGETRIYDFDPHSNSFKIAFHAFEGVDQLTFSQDGRRAAYVGGDVSHPEEIWAATSRFAQVHRLTQLNPQIDERTLGRAENVSWRSHNGTMFSGTLLLPVNYQPGRRYPMILWAYAGEDEGSVVRDNFQLLGSPPYFNLQLLASRGYAVFIPNSTLHIGNPMHEIASIILPGVDKIVRMGIADPLRLGVWGQSYGGYSTLSLIVQTRRFKAAVVTAGIVDLISFFATLYPDGSDWTAYTETSQGRMGGTPWRYRDRYIENSPFFYLDRVTTPVLLEYGGNDIADSIQMEQTFVALRRLGDEVTLLQYSGEGHVLTEPSNQINFMNRLLEWFATHL